MTVEMKKYKLGDIAKIYDGPHATPKKIDQGPIYLGINAVTEDCRIDPNGLAFLSEEDYKVWTKRVTPQHKDIVFSYEATLGRYAIIPENFYGCLGRRLGIVRVVDAKVNYEWLFYYFQSPQWKSFIKNHTIKGSTVDRISVEEMPNYEIPAIDISKQNRIALVLSTLDKRIENLRAQNRVLEQTAKTIYDYTFLQCAGHQTTYNKILNRNIPTNWEVKSVNQMAKSCRGVAYDKSDVQKENNGGILVLRGNNIQDNNLVYDGNVVYIPETLVEENQHIKKGDVIMTMSSGSKEHIGKCTMFQYDSEHTYGAFLTKFTPNKECRYYFYMNLISEYFKAKIKSVCNGTGINNLTNQTFDEIFFPYPDSKTLDTFEKTVTPIFDKMGVNTKQIETLTTQRNTLLPLLMTGQVEVL